jgi:hypothetical protein
MFAELSDDDQLDQVSEALQSLLGNHPSQQDYLALCQAARGVALLLEMTKAAQLASVSAAQTTRLV